MFTNVLVTLSLVASVVYAAPTTFTRRQTITSSDGTAVNLAEPCGDFLINTRLGSFPDSQLLLQCVVDNNLVPVSDRLKKIADEQVIQPFPGTRRELEARQRFTGPVGSVTTTDGQTTQEECADSMAFSRLGDVNAGVDLLKCLADSNMLPLSQEENDTILATGALN